MGKTRSPYPVEVRRQIVELVRAGRTPEELAREFEPSAKTIRHWVARADREEDAADDTPVEPTRVDRGGSPIRQMIALARAKSTGGPLAREAESSQIAHRVERQRDDGNPSAQVSRPTTQAARPEHRGPRSEERGPPAQPEHRGPRLVEPRSPAQPEHRGPRLVEPRSPAQPERRRPHLENAVPPSQSSQAVAQHTVAEERASRQGNSASPDQAPRDSRERSLDARPGHRGNGAKPAQPRPSLPVEPVQEPRRDIRPDKGGTPEQAGRPTLVETAHEPRRESEPSNGRVHAQAPHPPRESAQRIQAEGDTGNMESPVQASPRIGQEALDDTRAEDDPPRQFRDAESAEPPPLRGPLRTPSVSAPGRLSPPDQVSRTPFNGPSPVNRDNEVHLGQQLRVLWERKWVVIATVFVSVVIAFLYTRQMESLYAARSLIMIESRLPEIVEVDAVVGGLSVDGLTVESEVSVLKSRGLAEKVVAQLKLHEDPEFNPALRPDPQGLRAQLSRARKWLSGLIGGSEPTSLSNQGDVGREQATVIDAYLKRLNVAAKSKSRVILIKFTSVNPATAALVANTVADLYMLAQRESKLEAAQHATAWLNERSAALREKVVASERTIEKFKEDNELLEGARGAILSEQITDVNGELTRAATNRARLEARLARVQTLAGDPRRIDSAVEVLGSPVIQGLRDDYVKLERQKTELSGRFNPSHARIVSLEAEQKYLRQQITAEIDKVIKGLENEVAVAQAHEASLRASLNELKARGTQTSKALVELRELEREAEADRLLLTTFLSRLQETSAQKDIEFHQANARILSRATPPRQPLPTKKMVLALTFVGSLFIGVLLVIIAERRRTGDVFLSGEQIERNTNIPYLCLIPMAKAPKKKGASSEPSSFVIEQPRSAFAESIRGLYASILLSNIHAPPKTIMFTSAQPNEGKTTIAVSLARAQALNGKKVLVVDTDIRRPGVHELFQASNEPGLSELMQGTAQFQDVIQTDKASGAQFIAAGSGTANPFDTLSAASMETLLKQLSQSYDLVILDTPPLLAVPDARMLSAKVEATVFAIRWAKTKRDTATVAIRQVVESNGFVAGAVLSIVDTKKNAKYGYGDSGFYSGAASSYYYGDRQAQS